MKHAAPSADRGTQTRQVCKVVAAKNAGQGIPLARILVSYAYNMQLTQFSTSVPSRAIWRSRM